MRAVSEENSPFAGESIRNDSQKAELFLKQLFGGAWMTQAISVAAELGIADLLNNGPCSVQILAKQTETNCDALYRILRALASIGIFTEKSEGQFMLTETANLLRSDVSESQRCFAMLMGAEFHGAWGELLYSAQTGEPGFERKFGAPAFRYMLDHPKRHAIYDKAMGGYGRVEVNTMMDAYDFSKVRTIADVGGGSGMLLSAVLNRYPQLHGILFDLPAVAERARTVFADPDLSDRVRIVGGDFFSSIPMDADVYILQHVIHDWDDRDAILILHNCRKAMNNDSRILLVESVIPPGNEPSFGKWLDLMMLLVGGRERTREQYDQLFSTAGLRLSRVIPTAAEVSIIEGRRAS
jgi:hypothetical protein